MPPVLRSVLAIIAGFITLNFTVILLTLISISLLHLRTGHPTPGYLVFNVVYSLLAAVAAGFVAGMVAHFRPVLHGAVLALIMLGFGAFSYAHYTGTQPRWYQLMMIAVPPLCVLAGAAIYARSRPRFPPAPSF